MAGRCTDMDFLCVEYLGNRNIQSHPGLDHNRNKESPWNIGCYNPSWLQEKLSKQGLLRDGGFLAQQQKRDILTLRDLNHEISQKDTAVLVAQLKACAKQKDLSEGSRLHAIIHEAGLVRTDIYVGTVLVNMYAKCGALAKAQEVFDELPAPNVVSWNALISGYTQHGHEREVLNCYEQMQQQGLAADAITFTCMLKTCGSVGAAEKGGEIFAALVRQGLLEKDTILGNALVDMYAKCGALAKAREVFDRLPVPNVVSWNVLIAGYIEQGHCHDALTCFEQMQHQSLSPDPITFICILKACSIIGAVEKGKSIHAVVVRWGLLVKSDILGNALVSMYGKCGALAKAQEVFDELPMRNVGSWNTLIAGYAQYGHAQEVLFSFEEMQSQGLSPNAITFICILKACGSVGASEKGKEIHREVVKQGLLENDTNLGTALVDMYAKCAELAKAQEVFDELIVQDAVSWSTLIAGYAQHGHYHEAINCLEQMQYLGLSPDCITFATILKACGSVGAFEKGEEIHVEVVRQGWLEKNTILGNALVDMYAKCGVLMKAQQIFNELLDRNIVSWNAIIAGFAQHGLGHEALNCFVQMQLEGLSPDAVTFLSALKACGIAGAAANGEEIHAEVVKQGLLDKGTMLGNALIDMYATCGALAKAQEVFNELPIRDVVSWSALIAGYAQLGKVEAVFNLFCQMIGEGLEPNMVTFIVVLNACSHSGLVNDGEMYFRAMNSSYGITPTLEHHNCMLDLFSRAGHFDKALGVIEMLPHSHSSDFLLLWSTLLGACLKWGNVKLGRFAFDHAVQLDEKDAAAYICMSSIYATAGMREEADKVEAMRVRNNA